MVVYGGFSDPRLRIPEEDGVVSAPGSECLAIGRPSDTVDRLRVPFQYLQFSTCRDFPDVYAFIPAPGSQYFPVAPTRNTKRPFRALPFEAPQQLPRPCIPNSNGFLTRRTRCERSPV